MVSYKHWEQLSYIKGFCICRGIFGVGRIFVFCYDVSDYWDSEFRVRQLTVNAPTLRHFVVLNLASMCFNDNCQYLPDAFLFHARPVLSLFRGLIQ